MLTRFDIHDAGRGAIDFDAWPAWPLRASEWTGFARRDTDDAAIYTLDVPRYRKKDLTVDVDGRRVIVRGERSEGLLKPKLRRSFLRSFTLPDTLDPSDVRAALHDGVLSLTVAKLPAARSRRIAVNVDGRPAATGAGSLPPEKQPKASLWQRLTAKLHAAISPRERTAHPARS